MRLKTTQVIPARLALIRQQGGLCAVCERPFGDGVVACLDHDHGTGHIRGALCRACNRLEGKVKNAIIQAGGKSDPTRLLANLAKYLVFYSVPRTKYLHPTYKTPDEKRLEALAKQREKRLALKARNKKG